MLGGQGTSGRRHASSRRDQSGGTQTGLRNLQMYVIVALFDTLNIEGEENVCCYDSRNDVPRGSRR